MLISLRENEANADDVHDEASERCGSDEVVALGVQDIFVHPQVVDQDCIRVAKAKIPDHGLVRPLTHPSPIWLLRVS